MPSTSPHLRRLTAHSAMASALLCTCTAFAQDLTISFNENYGDAEDDSDNVTINLGDCKDNFDTSVDFALTFSGEALASGNQHGIYRDTTGSACQLSSTDTSFPNSTDDCIREVDLSNNLASVTFNDLTLGQWLGLDSPSDCEQDDQGNDASRLFVAYEVTDNVNLDTTFASESFRFNLDRARPTSDVTSVSVDAGQSSIKVNFETNGTGTSYNVYYGTSPFNEGDKPEDLNGYSVRRDVSTGVTLEDGVSVGRTYYIAVVNANDAGNESLITADSLAVANTQPTEDFYELYRGAGGQDPGFDCSSTPNPSRRRSLPALLLLASLAMGALLLRRRHRASQLLLASFALTTTLAMTPSLASAQDDEEPETSGLFGVRMGTYLPQVDQGLGLDSGGPYARAFGSESMFLIELTLDKPFYQGIGKAGVGFRLGTMDVEGSSINQDGTSSTDSTDFNIIPFRVEAFYRFDYLATEFDFPLVPVGAAGLDYFLWWIDSSENKLATSQGDTALGGVFGWHLTLGLHLMLDWFDTSSANSLFLDFGILNSFLYFDYTINSINDFGDDASIDLSDDHFMFGATFEY